MMSSVARAFPLTATVLVLATMSARAQDDLQLVAGEPTILVHPQINKSVGNPVLCVTFARKGAALVTGATSGALVWDVATGELRQTLEVDDRAVDSLAVDSKQRVLVTGGATGIIKVWDAHSFKPVRSLGPTPGAVRGLAISPDGKLLASTSPQGWQGAEDQDFGILLWELNTGEPLRTIPHPPPAFGTTVLAFLPGGKQLVTAQDRAFRILDVGTGEEEKVIDVPELPRTLGAMALRADGRQLVTGAFEPQLRLWDAGSWQQIRSWDAHGRKPPPERGVSSVGFSPDGGYVLSGGMDGRVCVWDASTGQRLLELEGGLDAPRRGWISGVAMSPDGRLLAASHYGGTATIWRITAEK